MWWWKTFENRSIFAEDMDKIQKFVAYFFGPPVYCANLLKTRFWASQRFVSDTLQTIIWQKVWKLWDLLGLSLWRSDKQMFLVRNMFSTSLSLNAQNLSLTTWCNMALHGVMEISRKETWHLDYMTALGTSTIFFSIHSEKYRSPGYKTHHQVWPILLGFYNCMINAYPIRRRLGLVFH